MDPVLSVTGLSKDFQGQRALNNVDFDLIPGEIHALLGQNGSGKSTLIKILAGYHRPERGARAVLNGAPFQLGSAAAAHAGGLRFIHQDLALIGALSVVENLALGESYTGKWWLSDRRERAAAARVFDEYGVDLDVTQPVLGLDPTQRTMTAIVRALYHAGSAGGGILVLDEPTASLPESQKDKLFELVRRVASQGTAVLYVTHRLQEVFEIAHRVTVLRDGRKVVTRPVRGLAYDDLVELIVGRPLASFFTEPPPPRTEVAFEAVEVGGPFVRNVSLKVHEGEILGVTGLTGSGIGHLLPLLFGAEARTRGEVRVRDAVVAASPWQAIKMGVAYAPSDRQRCGAVVQWTLRENVTLPRLESAGPLRWLSDRKEGREVKPWLELLNVTPADPAAIMSSLSGGNQQKTILAKWLRTRPAVLLLEDPTQGIDIGAKVVLYEALATAAKSGAAILMTSSDYEEICSVCDRVLIMRRGRIAAEFAGDGRTVDNVAHASLQQDVVAGDELRRPLHV